MAKKHLLEATNLLLEKYEEAQKLYEEAAEIFSEEMISPDEQEKFNKIKGELDSSLSTLSTFLSEAYLHPDRFQSHFWKEVKMAKEFFKLSEDFSFTKKVRESYFKRGQDCMKFAETASHIDQIRIFPKAEKRQKKHYGILRNEVLKIKYRQIFLPMNVDILLIRLKKFIKGEEDV